MKIKKDNNTLYINGNKREFDNVIDTVLEFSNCCIILLMNDNIPDNNILAIGCDGNVLWNISEIIKFSFPEAYITISKESNNTFSAITYNGVRYLIDIIHRRIVSKEVTK